MKGYEKKQTKIKQKIAGLIKFGMCLLRKLFSQGVVSKNLKQMTH